MKARVTNDALSCGEHRHLHAGFSAGVAACCAAGYISRGQPMSLVFVACIPLLFILGFVLGAFVMRAEMLKSNDR